MVNVKKHELLKKNQSIKKYTANFERWVLDFFENDENAYYYLWGGFNGAIHRKLNNWNPDDEEWYEHEGLYYARSNNEIMLAQTIYGFLGSEEVTNRAWENIKRFLNNLDVDLIVGMYDANALENMFDVFKLFDDAKNWDMLFLKNMTRELNGFLVDFGITECIDYFYFFYSEEESDEIIKSATKDPLGDEKHVTVNYDEPIFMKENKIGFELYENLKEWKKEVTAPTRNDPEYRKMKKRVRERDDFTCQCCGYRNTEKVNHGLEVHHIFGYKDHLDYRTEDSNCVTLCNDCHKKYHSIYGKNNVTPITFSTFIRDYHTYSNKDIQTTLDSI